MKIAVKLLALIVVLLSATALPAWASQGIGSSPYAADLLVSGLNTGRLNPGEEYWYAYSRLDLGDPAYTGLILNLGFKAEGRAVANRVNFQVFTFEQVDAWLQDNSGPVDSLGLGTALSADFDANTGERLWAGPMAENEVYYVRIFNLSPSPISFRLNALGQENEVPGAFMGGASPEVIPAAMSLPADSTEPALPARSSATTLPMPVSPQVPGSVPTNWLLATQAIQAMPPAEAAAWLMSAVTLGWLPMGNTAPAMVPVDPNARMAVVPGGGEGGGGAGASAGGAAAVPVDPNRGTSIYPNEPLRLLEGGNTGRLAPKAEHWYTFIADKEDGRRIKNMSLTMFFTPGEPNLARYVTFELFTGSQYNLWERGTPDDMEHFGAGSWVSRDWDYNTGERLWHGTVVDGDRYFIKVTNGTNKDIDYHLFTGDIVNTELGPTSAAQSIPAAPEAAPTGRDIGSPLPAARGHNRGVLSAGEETWLAFESKTTNPDKFEFQHFVLTLDHTPGAGYVTNYVNFEIYPYQEQQIWRRGDTDQIQPLGAGSDLRYDRSSDTHTWVWDGHMVANTIYFIRIRNGSPHAINYDLSIQRRIP